MNTVYWTVRAAKQLRKLHRLHQVAVRDAVSTLANMPACTNVVRLVNHDYAYRLRVGDYRVLFNWEGSVKIVQIEAIRKRDERTY